MPFILKFTVTSLVVEKLDDNQRRPLKNNGLSRVILKFNSRWQWWWKVQNPILADNIILSPPTISTHTFFLNYYLKNKLVRCRGKEASNLIFYWASFFFTWEYEVYANATYIWIPQFEDANYVIWPTVNSFVLKSWKSS